MREEARMNFCFVYSVSELCKRVSFYQSRKRSISAFSAIQCNIRHMWTGRGQKAGYQGRP